MYAPAVLLDVETYRVAPNGSGIVVALAVFPECNGNEIACTAERLKAKQGGKSSGQVYDKLFLRHWDTWKDGTRNHLFYLPLPATTASAIALTDGLDGDVPSKPFGGNEDFVISNDGRTVYFSARVAGKTEPWSTNFDIYCVHVSGGELKNLTAANPAWDASPVISPDGTKLAYKAMARPGYEADRFQLKVMDLATSTTTDVARVWDRSAASLAWSRDGKSLLVTADDLGKDRLFRIDVKTSTVSALSTDGHLDVPAYSPARNEKG